MDLALKLCGSELSRPPFMGIPSIKTLEVNITLRSHLAEEEDADPDKELKGPWILVPWGVL